MVSLNQAERFDSVVDTVLDLHGHEKRRPILPRTKITEGIGSLVVADMGLVIFSRDTVKAGGRNALRRIVEVPSERIMVLSCENESGQITRLLEHSYGTDDRVTSILRLVTRRSLESPEQTKLNRWLERPYTTAFPGRLIKRLNIAEEDELTRFRRQVDDCERQFVDIDMAYRQTGFIQDKDWRVTNPAVGVYPYSK